MVFSSAIFLFIFLPIVLIVYYILPKNLRNFWLFLSSFVFYAWSGLSYAILILFSTIINYCIGKVMSISEGKKRKLVLIIGVLYNLGILGFFKYFNFIVLNIVHIIQNFIPNYTLNAPFIPLPIGISFFTFQIMSYIIDLYRKQIPVQKNFINLGLYIMLFPQLIAGPIVRYIDVEKQIVERSITVDSFESGLKRFILGLGKKVIIANAMGQWADAAFNNLNTLSTPLAWLGIMSYTFQIFFDFSAYSDMAIGLGHMFGFTFLENFNYPYSASSMQDYWRRWHMSLTTWFRDYLYIPLGGNRKGKIRTYFNNFIVFFCTGLWHGAAWNFVFWGLYHGIFLIVEKIGLGNIIRKLPKILLHFYVMLIVMVGWVFFRANGLREGITYLRYMFSLKTSQIIYFFKVLDIWKISMFILAIIFSTPIIKKLSVKIEVNLSEIKYEIISDLLYIILFLLSISFIAGSGFNPFIYFRF